MHIPQTYEEFIHTPKKELIALPKEITKMEDFERISEYYLRAKKELKANKLISEGTNVQNDTIYEDIHYGEI